MKPDISLPLLELAPLSDDEVRELEKVILSDGRSDYFSIVGMMSTTLRSLCVNPLLLRLTLSYGNNMRISPKRLSFSFDHGWTACLRQSQTITCPRRCVNKR